MEANTHTPETHMPLWEIFSQEKTGKPHEHVGSLHAPDATMALQSARDAYARRGSTSLWVVPAEAIIASTPEDSPMLFDSAADKVYRHPQFYEIPRSVRL
ncbi:MAG: 1,2-phenylacetyl-CoA epoxidase subunit PaaB [SAR324 cluster bacterium]|nr:1,2-phenylacetyl-CoA epoxidase subunit PaaB [SAR324 cluster bacterium]